MKADQPLQPGQLDELASRIAYLMAGYMGESLTEEEHQELDDWVTASMDNQRLFEDLTDPNNLAAMLAYKEKLHPDQVLDRLRSQLTFTPEPTTSRFQSWRSYAIAASVLVVTATTVIFFVRTKTTFEPQPTVSHVKGKDIAPGFNQATLTLADGSLVNLSNRSSGVVRTQGNVMIVQQDSGHINYTSSQLENAKTAEFNTLTVPKGGQFRVTLPDGSGVWLNAASSLRYPVFFSGDQRLVELAGEAYFEIAKDAQHPFVVKTGNTTVQVLGTHFDINAYDINKAVRVILAEGAVSVNNSIQIKPGQEAIVNSSGQIKTVPADLETSLAWKDGFFKFKDASIDEVLNQINRWYDAEIINQASTSEHFNALIPRNVPVSKLLHLLESTGSVQFKIEGKKIIVLK